jgi:hypothetical protein
MTLILQIFLVVILIALFCGAVALTTKIFTDSAEYLCSVILACISFTAVGIDMFHSTSSAWNALTPLMQRFEEVAISEPDHRYASNERGSTLDYGGDLDDILWERSILTEKMGLVGMMVYWQTDGYWVSFSGVYFNGLGVLICLSIWPVCVLLLYSRIRWIRHREKNGYRPHLPRSRP